MDGEVEYVLDEAYSEMVDLLPCTLQAELAAPQKPHRPVRQVPRMWRSAPLPDTRCPASSRHKQAGNLFFALSLGMIYRKIGASRVVRPGERPRLLVVHLFSGRRRVGDFHWHLQQMADAMGVTFVILSMDTAVSPFWGDLHRSSPSWQFLARCYQAGLVAGTLTGTPCETFSEARFTEPPEGLCVRWPRPVRSAELLYGLPGLTLGELRQVQLGSSFFCKVLRRWVLIWRWEDFSYLSIREFHYDQNALRRGERPLRSSCAIIQMWIFLILSNLSLEQRQWSLLDFWHVECRGSCASFVALPCRLWPSRVRLQ